MFGGASSSSGPKLAAIVNMAPVHANKLRVRDELIVSGILQLTIAIANVPIKCAVDLDERLENVSLPGIVLGKAARLEPPFLHVFRVFENHRICAGGVA